MRRLVLFLLLLLGLGGAGWLSLGKIEREMVYPFAPERVDPAVAALPGLREVTFKTLGQSLITWVAPAQPDKPTILYFHGNAGNLANRAARFRLLLDRGYGLIAPAYRGSSGSTGRPSEAALTQDARALWTRLDTFQPGLMPDRVILYGESLGTGVALKLAAQQDLTPPAALVLEAPYTSLPDVVRHLYPQLEALIPRMTNIWDSRSHAAAVHVPLMVLHGSEDRLIPPGQGRAVFEAAPALRKQYYEIEGASHSDTWRDATLAQLWAFIDAVPVPPKAP